MPNYIISHEASTCKILFYFINITKQTLRYCDEMGFAGYDAKILKEMYLLYFFRINIGISSVAYGFGDFRRGLKLWVFDLLIALIFYPLLLTFEWLGNISRKYRGKSYNKKYNISAICHHECYLTSTTEEVGTTVKYNYFFSAHICVILPV